MKTAELKTGEGLLNDRRFAITKQVSSTMNGQWMTCRSFFINTLDDGLQRLSQQYDDQQGQLTLSSDWGGEILLDVRDSESFDRANAMLPLFMEPFSPDAAFPPMLAERRQARGVESGYWDYDNTTLSIINLTTIEALADTMGVELDPRRFRGNLYIRTAKPWDELMWTGKRITMGNAESGAELEILRPIDRCPATSVNPKTAIRDTKTPEALVEHFGHNFCGVYARVARNGVIKPGTSIEVVGDSTMSHEEAIGHGAPDYKLWPKPAQVIHIGSVVDNPEAKAVTLASSTPWLLPEAKPGQRIRFHLGAGLNTSAFVQQHQNNTTTVLITPSKTGDPATARLLEATREGDLMLISGPFGRT